MPAHPPRTVGKYRLVRPIGAGGMGTVYEAVHVTLGHRVAVKMLLAESRGNSEALLRFEREAKAAARLRSQHVVRVYDVDITAGGEPFLVMELLEGHDMADELARRRWLPVGEAVAYVMQACAGLSEAHAQGIIHRDLKPENLFLSRQDGETVVKVLDFGISKLVDDDMSRITQTATGMGTPQYMSPEQIRAARDVDGRADIWALGAIVYELVSGRPPFRGANAMAVIASIVTEEVPPLDALRRNLPAGFVAAVMRALSKDPNDRQASVEEFAASLAPYASHPLSPVEPPADEDPLYRAATLPRVEARRATTLNASRSMLPTASSRRAAIPLGIAAGALAALVVALAMMTTEGTPDGGAPAAPALVASEPEEDVGDDGGESELPPAPAESDMKAPDEVEKPEPSLRPQTAKAKNASAPRPTPSPAPPPPPTESTVRPSHL